MKYRDTIVLGILSAGLLMGSYVTAPARAAGSAGSGQQLADTSVHDRNAPDWQLKDPDGKPVKLSDFKGKVVILNFWATWCPPCRKEIPTFISLQKQYAPRGLVIVGVSLDEKQDVVKPFVAKMGINYPIVMGDAKIAADYGGIEVLPSTFVIDRNGKVSAVLQGDAERETFEGEIKPLL